MEGMLRIGLECIPCVLSIVIRTSRYAAGGDLEKQKEILKKALSKLSRITWEENPMDVSSELQELVTETTGVRDPYREIKRKSNEAVLRYYPKLERMVEESSEPLKTAAKIAAAGNLIDLAAYSSVDLDAPLRSLERAEFAIDDYDKFAERVLNAEKLLFLFDNAGEVIFDKLLIETMVKVRRRPFDRITFVGKEKPLINDVTSDELRELGFESFPNAIIKSLGFGNRGSVHLKNGEVRRWFGEHDLIILKGQGNLEAFFKSVSAFFLLAVKCVVVERALGVKQGSFVLLYSEK